MSFAENPPAVQPLSTSELRKRILYALEQKTTGIARISFLTGEEMLLLISGGDIRQIYFKEKNVFRRSSGLWDEHLQAANPGHFAIQLMPMRRLFFEKAILETPEAGKEIKPTFKTSDLSGLFLSMVNLESASLAHICWQTAEAFILVPGSKIPRRQAVFVSKNVTEENSAALSCIQNHPGPKCDLTIYRGGIESEAWLELHLNILFEWLCNYMLSEYGYLTGKVMVTSAAQNLMIFSSQSGWEVNRIGGEVADRTIFSSPAVAGDAYREMLALIGEHMTAVVGSTLFQSVKRQGLVSVNPFYQSLAKAYELIQ